MPILLTGASGFIGTALSRRLLLENHDVRALGLRQSVDAVRFFQGAIDDPVISRQALAGVDCVVHLAGRAHRLNDTDTKPLEKFREINCELSVTLARQAKLAGVRRFIFISSIGVNGSSTQGVAFDERTIPCPHSDYALSKYEAEIALTELIGDGDMELVIIRPPLVYGPNAPGNFGRLIRCVERGVPLPFGSIQNKRSLIGLDNLVDLIICCIDHPAAAGQVFVASDGEDISTTELLVILSNSLGRPMRIFPVPERLLSVAATILGKQNVAQSLLGSLQVDISKARKLLGWVPPISMKEGLRRCVCDTDI